MGKFVEMISFLQDVQQNLAAMSESNKRLKIENEHKEQEIDRLEMARKEQAEHLDELTGQLVNARTENGEFARIIEEQTHEINNLKKEVLFFAREAFEGSGQE